MLNNNIYSFQNNGIKQDKFDKRNGELNNIDSSDRGSDNNNKNLEIFSKTWILLPTKKMMMRLCTSSQLPLNFQNKQEKISSNFKPTLSANSSKMRIEHSRKKASDITQAKEGMRIQNRINDKALLTLFHNAQKKT